MKHVVFKNLYFSIVLFSAGGILADQPCFAGLARDLLAPKHQTSLFNLTQAVSTDNRVTLLHLGKNSKKARAELIQSAQHFIFIIVPYWFQDEEGQDYFNLLQAQKDKFPELDIRIISDWSTPGSSDDLFATGIYRKLKQLTLRPGEVLSETTDLADGSDRDEGQVRLWNRPSWLKSWSWDVLANRLHEKLLIVDGRAYIMGGMNVGNDYLLGGADSRGWHDTDIRVEGPGVQWATALFLKLWETIGYLRDVRKPFPFWSKHAAHALQDVFYDDSDKMRLQWTLAYLLPLKSFTEDIPHLAYRENSQYFPALPQDPQTLMTYDSPVRLIYDNPLIDRDESGDRYSKTLQTLEYLLSLAKERVRIFIPYLTITQWLRDLLLETSRRGIAIEILTNSLQSHDLGDTAYLGALPDMRALIEGSQAFPHPIRLFEWQGHDPLRKLESDYGCKIPGASWPGHTLHSKAIIIDGEVTLIGSNNWNLRSQIFNSELTALVESPTLSHELEAVFEQDLDVPEPRTVVCDGLTLERPRRVKEIDKASLQPGGWFFSLFKTYM